MFRRLVMWLGQPDHLFITLCSLIPMVLVLLYMTTNGYPYPFRDSWSTPNNYLFEDFNESDVNVAIKTVEGTLTFDDLMIQHNQHRIFFTKLFTAILTVTTGWRTEYGLILTFLGALFSFLLLGYLVTTRHDRAAILLIPFSLLIFTLRQDHVWTWAILNSSVLVATFYLAALTVIFTRPIQGSSLALAIVFQAASTFTFSSGLVGWPVLLVGLWARGYRDRRHYAALLLAMVVTIGLFFTGYDVDNVNTITTTIPYKLAFLPRALGAAVMPAADANDMPDLALMIGLSGLILWGVNVVFLMVRQRDWRQYGAWLTLGVLMVAALAMTSLGRSLYYVPRYSVMTNLLWLDIVVLAFFAIRKASQNPQARLAARALMIVNVVALAALTASYLWANIPGPTDYTEVEDDIVNCVSNYPIDMNDRCMRPLTLMTDSRPIYQRISDLSRYRLSVYADLKPAASLQAYTPGDPVIIEAPDVRQHFHILDRWPADRRPERVLHILEPGQAEAVSALLGTEAQYADSRRPTERNAAIAAFTGDAARVWLLYVGDQSTAEDWFHDAYGILLQQPAYAEPHVPFTTVAYTSINDLFQFGDQINLQGWELRDSVQVAVCQEVPVSSLWSASASLTKNYSMTLVLADANGVGIARADGNPSDILPRQWQPGWVYQDERTLTVPCDLQPGEYALLIGLYDFETLAALPITTSDGAPVGDLLYLTTLFVS